MGGIFLVKFFLVKTYFTNQKFDPKKFTTKNLKKYKKPYSPSRHTFDHPFLFKVCFRPSSAVALTTHSQLTRQTFQFTISSLSQHHTHSRVVEFVARQARTQHCFDTFSHTTLNARSLVIIITDNCLCTPPTYLSTLICIS